MTYNVFGGMLSLTQSINQPSPILYLEMYRYWCELWLHAFHLTFLARLVQHCYFSCRLRQLVQEMPGWPRSEQMNVQQSNVLAMLVHVVHGLLQCLAGWAHADGNAIGSRRAVVVEQLVFAASHFTYFVHCLLHDLGSLSTTDKILPALTESNQTITSNQSIRDAPIRHWPIIVA